MKVWLWPVNQDNWPTVKSKNVWAVNTPGKGKRVEKGDKIIFYVRGIKYFEGIFEVSSEWHNPTITWPDEKNAGDLSASEIDLKPIALGYASLHKLRSSLNFLKGNQNIGLVLRGTPAGPANNGKPILEKDYDLILEELKKVQELPLEKESKDDIDLEEFVDVSDWSFIKERIHELPPPNLKSISSIIADVENGKYAVPMFQREFTWNRTQVEELWESIFQGFFIGSILTWNSNEEFKTIPINGAPELNNPTDIILDGQQRITSLYYAVTAPDIALTDVRSVKFFIDLKALMDPTASGNDIVISYHTSEAKSKGYLEKETQFAKKLFPLSKFYKRDYVIWLNEFKNYLKEVEEKSEEDAHSYYDNLMHILDYVWFEYKIPMVQLPKSMTLDSVAEVFEKINSTGTPLGVFDLLNARFTRYDVNLRTLWEQARSNFDNITEMDDKLGKNAERFLIQTISLYKKGYCRRKELLSLDSSYVELNEFQKESFEKDWGKSCLYISKTIDKLTSQRESGFGAVKFNIIPYTVIIPILAALMYKIENRDDQTKCKNKIETWYWSTVISDSYSGSTDSKIEKDFRELQLWFDDDLSIPEMVREQRRAFDDINFNSTRSNQSVYRLIMCLISKKGASDFVTDEPPEYSKLDDHHIFPRSKKDKYGGTTPIDSVLNRTLIDSATNRKFIRNQDPSKYLKEIMEKQGIDENTLRKRLETHLISPVAFDCLLRDDFNGFVEERLNTIRNECRKLIFPEPTDESKISKILHSKEDLRLEYKSSLRWDIKENQQNTALEEVIAKDFSSFMNAGGGNLLIGVDDNGNPIGLEKDYSTFKDKSSDGFSQHVTNLVNKYLDKNSNAYLDLLFHRVDGKEICQCKIKRAPRPIYLTKNYEKKFFVRMNNTSQPLDMEEAHKYISENWK